MLWNIQTTDYSREAIPDNGNRFLVGNGYMGLRGTLDEQGKEELAALNLAGIYDQVGSGWREPLNAPYPLHTLVYAGGRALALPDLAPVHHEQSLDFYYGIAARKTVWNTEQGRVTVESRRFADMARPHVLGAEFTVSADCPMELELRAEITPEIWEIYGPHYNRVQFSRREDTLLCLADVQNGKDRVALGRTCRLSGEGKRQETDGGFWYKLNVEPKKPVTLFSLCAVYTTLDGEDPLALAEAELRGKHFEGLLAEHKAAWEKIWSVGRVEIRGDEDAEAKLNYSLYHLNSIAPRHRDDLSIPARGLSGQTYKGAIFWDSEIFMLDYFLYTQPEVARSMVRYRIETLPGAMEKARHYGWQGAFYAWESQEGGWDGCSDYNVTDVFTKRPMRTFFRDKQVHISAAVARAVMLYVEVTGDKTLLSQGGARTVLECARFYYSLLLGYADRNRWEIHDVIGPDEYHERVNNNAYTNKMAGKTMGWAIQAAELLRQTDGEGYKAFCRETGAEALLPKLQSAAEKLYVPEPGKDGVIPQFDGYFDLEDATVAEVRSRLLDPREYWGGAYGVASHTRVIKQADVVTMLEMFHREYDPEILEKNWRYYEPRTEHGSSLSACMYALLACRFGQADRAYPFFLKSAQADWVGGGKQWAGLVYIGGTHPAAEGGAWKVLAEGFAGLDTAGGRPQLKPCLPEGWEAVTFRFCCRGRWYRAELAPGESRLTEL